MQLLTGNRGLAEQAPECTHALQGRSCRLTPELTSMHGIDTEGGSLADKISGIAPVLEEHFGSGGEDMD